MIEKTLHFIRESTAYYAVGQPAENYFDLSLIPLESNACTDILEKTRLLFALWELFISIDTNKTNRLIPHLLIIDLKKYFERFDASHWAYWNLLEYETLKIEQSSFFCYEIDKTSNNLALLAGDIKIIIPYPYENLIAEGDFDVDESNFSSFKFFGFNQDEDFPTLFMSNQQRQKNESEINKYFEEIISICNIYQDKINNCDDIENIYINIDF